jgi:hypothetical protein
MAEMIPSDDKEHFVTSIKLIDVNSFKPQQAPTFDEIRDAIHLMKTELAADQLQLLLQLLWVYKDVFSQQLVQPGAANHIPHRVATGEHGPIFQCNSRFSKKETETIDKEVKTMLEANVVRPGLGHNQLYWKQKRMEAFDFAWIIVN